MVIWKFYRRDQSNQIIIEEKYELDRPYAITDKKKYAKEFMDTRNMDLFVVAKEELDDYDNFNSYVSANELRYDILDKRTFKYKCVDNSGLISMRYTDILTTYFEYDYVMEESDVDIDGISYTWWASNFEKINTYPLKNIYREILNKFFMIDKYKIYFASYISTESAEKYLGEVYDPASLSDGNNPDTVDKDEVAILISSKGYLFK